MGGRSLDMNTLISKLERVFMAVAVGCMVAIMLLVSIDALGRYLFNSPLQWAYELVTYFLMVAVVYFAASSTFQQGDHVGVDLFYHMMSPRIRVWSMILCSLLAVIVFGLITWSGFKDVAKYYTENDFIIGYVLWPTWLSYIPIPLGAGLMVLRMLNHAFTLMRDGQDPNVVDHLDGIATESAE